MFKLLKKKRTSRVVTVTRELRELTNEERALINKRPVTADVARLGDIIETAFGLFLVIS